MSQHGSDKTRAILIGIGNEYRGDDTFGFEVVRRIKDDLHPEVEVVLTEGDGVTLMQRWAGCDTVILVDCIRSGAPVGTQFKLNAAERTLPTHFFRSSSHLFGIAEAVEMARALKQLPRTLIVFGVEGRQFDLGEPMSREVRATLEPTADAIKRELHTANSCPAGPQ